MTIHTTCPFCDATLRAPDSAAGKNLKCPECNASIRVEEVPEFDGPSIDLPPPDLNAVPPRASNKTCPLCAERIAAEAIKCRHCGSMLVPIDGLPRADGPDTSIYPGRNPKDPVLMGILSGCCIGGVGQMILGQVVKGLAMMVGAALFTVATSGFGFFAVWPLMGIDAYLVARKLHRGKAVTKWESFPAG